MAGEIISSIIENVDLKKFKTSPQRITLPDSPAPTSKLLENQYYINNTDIVQKTIKMVN